MKLYYSPGVCSLAPHIVLSEAGYNYELEKVNLKEKVTENGGDYKTITEKGLVPVLELDNGEVITEGPAIMQYLADKKPEKNLVPANGTIARTRLQEWLNYISTEMHKSHYPLFHPELGDKAVEFYRGKVKEAYNYVSAKLENKNYLFDDQFTIVDAYIFTVLNWSKYIGIELSNWHVLRDYHARVASREGVKRAMSAEGLID